VNEIERRARLQQLFVQHAAAVRAYARRRTDETTADETVGEVFVVAWRRLDDLPQEALPWLLACARRILANQRRADRRRSALHARLTEAAGLLPQQTASQMLGGRLGAALEQLRESDRELLLLTAWECLDAPQVAQVMGCSPRTLAVRLHRARRRLSRALDRTPAEPHTTPVEPDPTTQPIEVPR
jgi:RNA polymerase sigma-70 factor (ECF subfamily)